MKNHDAAEMYLETILLLETKKGCVHSKDIADSLEVSKASVTKALNNLKKKEYITQDNYGPVYLTDFGRETSKHILYKHRLITLYLKQDLNLSDQEADENACRMEHIITDEMLKKIEDKLSLKIEDKLQFALEDLK